MSDELGSCRTDKDRRMEVQKLPGDARGVLIDIDITARIKFLIHGIPPANGFQLCPGNSRNGWRRAGSASTATMRARIGLPKNVIKNGHGEFLMLKMIAASRRTRRPFTD